MLFSIITSFLYQGGGNNKSPRLLYIKEDSEQHMCYCGMPILYKNMKKHLQSQNHKKLFYMKENKPEYWDLLINADTSDPHYHAKVKKVDRY